MRKTSQDGGDSTSITSGAENEFKKSGILKSKRNSVKRKVQSLSHDHEDGIIEPLLQKENEKTETGNESAKQFSSKLKTDSTSNKGNDTEKLLADKNVENPTISDIPGIPAASHFDAIRKVNSMASTRNHMHSNVFSSNAANKDPAKSQILAEIDANKQSVYNPSPLIFTTAKIHTDGNAKHMDLVNVTPIPIVSTIEGKITKSGCIVESNGSITHKIDNNLSIGNAKAGANSLVNAGTTVGENSVNKSNSSQSQVTPNTKTLLADSIPEPEKSGKSLISNPVRYNENIVDINKNIETVDINSINLKSNVSVANEKNLRNPSEVKAASSQNLTLHYNTSVGVLSGTSNTCTTGFSNFFPIACSSNVSVASKTMESQTTACSESVTETKNAALISKTKSPISSIKTSHPISLTSSSKVAQTPTSTTIKSNFAAKDLTTPKSTAVSTVESISLSKSIPSTNTVTNSSSFIKDSKPFKKQNSSASAGPSQVKNKTITVSNTTTATTVNQSSKASSYSTNTKISVGQVPNSIPVLSVSVNSTMASSIAKTTSGLKTKPDYTTSTILLNKTSKAIVSKSSAPTTTAASSTGIKIVSKAKAITTPTASTNKSNSTSTGKDSAVGSKLITNKIPATTNTIQLTRTTLSSATATSAGTVPSEPSVANELTNTETNERKDGKGKA